MGFSSQIPPDFGLLLNSSSQVVFLLFCCCCCCCSAMHRSIHLFSSFLTVGRVDSLQHRGQPGNCRLSTLQRCSLLHVFGSGGKRSSVVANRKLLQSGCIRSVPPLGPPPLSSVSSSLSPPWKQMPCRSRISVQSPLLFTFVSHAYVIAHLLHVRLVHHL